MQHHLGGTTRTETYAVFERQERRCSILYPIMRIYLALVSSLHATPPAWIYNFSADSEIGVGCTCIWKGVSSAPAPGPWASMARAPRKWTGYKIYFIGTLLFKFVVSIAACACLLIRLRAFVAAAEAAPCAVLPTNWKLWDGGWRHLEYLFRELYIFNF